MAAPIGVSLHVSCFGVAFCKRLVDVFVTPRMSLDELSREHKFRSINTQQVDRPNDELLCQHHHWGKYNWYPWHFFSSTQIFNIIAIWRLNLSKKMGEKKRSLFRLDTVWWIQSHSTATSYMQMNLAFVFLFLSLGGDYFQRLVQFPDPNRRL